MCNSNSRSLLKYFLKSMDMLVENKNVWSTHLKPKMTEKEGRQEIIHKNNSNGQQRVTNMKYIN